MFFDFRKGYLPTNWLLETANHYFSDDGLNSGQIMLAKMKLTGELPEYYNVELHLAPKGMFWISDGTYEIIIDFIRKQVIMSYGRFKLKTSSLIIPEGRDFLNLKLFFYSNKIATSIDDDEILSMHKPVITLPSNLYSIGFFDECLIHNFQDNIEIFSRTAGNGKKDCHLEVNVDFYDDLIHAPFTNAMIDKMFDEFKSWGLKRCHWIYYGGQKNGWWSGCLSPVCENARKTFENVGDIFATAVKAAHKRGIELYGLIKPFDMGLQYSMKPASEKVERLCKLNTISGPHGWIADFPAKHRELITCRRQKDYSVDKDEKIVRIELIKEDDMAADFTVEDLELYVSNDNAEYCLYDGPIKRMESVENHEQWIHDSSGGRASGKIVRARVMRLTELNINKKFFAIKVNKTNNSFGNKLVDIIHVFGDSGELRRITLGITARRAQPAGQNDFRKVGVEFDLCPGVSSAVVPGFNMIKDNFYLDGKQGFIAIAKGKEPGAFAVLSPSFPETRKWWLSWVEDILNAGADGVELRVRNHHSPLTWDEYGFEQPVVDEYRKRYGVDLNTTNDFDHELWRKLRGEAYTQFYREAKELVSRNGKKLGLHISTTMNAPVANMAAMNIHWDWKTWLNEGLADVVTLKEVWPGTPFAKEVMTMTKKLGIPVVFCPYANDLFLDGRNGLEACANRIALAREACLDGFQFYECAAVVRGNPDGGITMLQPDLRKLFAKNFCNT